MKAYFKNMLKGYSGKMDDCIMYYHPKLDVCLVRSKPEFKPNERTERLKNIMENLKAINPSQGYKQNYKDYLIQYNNLKVNWTKQAINWSNLYLKMLYNLAKQNPEVDLLTISRAEIETEQLPCRTIKTAIEAGLLPEVSGYQRFDNEI